VYSANIFASAADNPSKKVYPVEKNILDDLSAIRDERAPAMSQLSCEYWFYLNCEVRKVQKSENYSQRPSKTTIAARISRLFIFIMPLHIPKKMIILCAATKSLNYVCKWISKIFFFSPWPIFIILYNFLTSEKERERGNNNLLHQFKIKTTFWRRSISARNQPPPLPKKWRSII
jgi:hypothetical protein